MLYWSAVVNTFIIHYCRAEKEAKLKEKELIKELERNKREVEKEKKRMERELQKERCQSVSEITILLIFYMVFGYICMSILCGP